MEPAPRTEDRTCDGVPGTVVHDFDAMDRNAGDDRRKGPAGEQQHAGPESEHFSDAYDSRQVCTHASFNLFCNENTLKDHSSH